MNSTSDTATPPRITVRIPTASGDEIEAWLYLPAGEGPHPAVVMAATRAARRRDQVPPAARRPRARHDGARRSRPPRRRESPHAELYRSRGGHYDVYKGGADYDNVVQAEVEFFNRLARAR